MSKEGTIFLLHVLDKETPGGGLTLMQQNRLYPEDSWDPSAGNLWEFEVVVPNPLKQVLTSVNVFYLDVLVLISAIVDGLFLLFWS